MGNGTSPPTTTMVIIKSSQASMEVLGMFMAECVEEDGSVSQRSCRFLYHPKDSLKCELAWPDKQQFPWQVVNSIEVKWPSVRQELGMNVVARLLPICGSDACNMLKQEITGCLHPLPMPVLSSRKSYTQVQVFRLSDTWYSKKHTGRSQWSFSYW